MTAHPRCRLNHRQPSRALDINSCRRLPLPIPFISVLPVSRWLRCHYTKSNPIDDHSNISSKMFTEAEFQTIGQLYLHAVWYLPFTNSPRKHTVTYHFSNIQEVYSGNRQIHTKCHLQYLHPPHISTSGKCHCVIIHHTTKATEYIG